MQMRLPTALAIWIFSCVLAGFSLDLLATRPLQVNVEAYRQSKELTDEQVVNRALQEARQMSENWWWFRSRKATLVFSAKRQYDPVVYQALPFTYVVENTKGYTVRQAAF